MAMVISPAGEITIIIWVFFNTYIAQLMSTEFLQIHNCLILKYYLIEQDIWY
jgi:hypothetical protein